MAKRKDVWTNFSAGELDPQLVIRSDVQAWRQGAKQLVNLRARLHGGVTTRPGTNWCADIGAEAWQIPFEFDETQGYTLLFKGSTIDVYYDDGTFAVTVAGCPWTLAQAKELGVAQSGDTMILTHKNVGIHKLVRTGSAAFALSTYDFTVDSTNNVKYAPFYRYAASAITLTPSATTGAITVTASSAVFQAGHVNTYFRIGGKQIKCTGYTDSTHINATVYETLASTSATTDWDEEALTAVRGYPRAVCFHNDRLCFGGSLSRPSGTWMSKVGSFYDFRLGSASDADAIWAGVSSDKVVSVLHMGSFRHLSIFTDTAEFFQPESDTKPLSPTTVAFKPQTGYGSLAGVRPQRFDDALLFVQKFGEQVREFLYSDTVAGYSSDAVSVMNPRRISSPVSMATLVAASGVKEQYAFIVMSNGGMAVLHSLRAQRVTAWAWWETDGAYLSVCSVNGKLFAVVRRTIAGVTKYYLEKFDFTHALDCAKTVAVTVGGTAASGLAHLEGKTVQAVNNGYALNPVAVSGGAITQDDVWQAASSLIGLPYSWTLELLPVEVMVEDGPSRGRRMRIVKAGIQVHESVALRVAGQSAWISNVDDDYSVPPSPQSGMYDFFVLGWDRSKTLTIGSDVPLPVTILGCALEVAG